MPKEKFANQKTYKLSISKSYTFPSSVIDGKNVLWDLKEKCINEFLQEAAAGKLDTSGFECKLDVEMPFTIKSSRNPIGDVRTKEGNSVYDVLRHIIIHNLEKKYGKFDHTVNPHLFIFEEDDDTEELIVALNYKIEEEMIVQVEELLSILRGKIL